MIKAVKKFFTRFLFRLPELRGGKVAQCAHAAPMEMPVVAAMPPAPPLSGEWVPDRPAASTASQLHREARLKRLMAISNPPAWVLAEIEELKRTD